MMFEREQVLNGLKCHSGCDRAFNCCDCAYIGYSNCSEILANDALALLKEKEVKYKPKRDYDINEAGFVYKVCHCGNCGALLKGGDFCGYCGKEVDWNV